MTEAEVLTDIRERLERIEQALGWIYHKQSSSAVKEHYTIAEFAELNRRAEYTCREWARTGRIKATKCFHGHGRYKTWVVSHEELLRFRREGLLPERFR